MRLLSFAYRFATNFVFLATVYLSLNYIEKYNNRAILAISILIYAGLRAAIALRSFYFFQRIERLEIEARRVIALFATRVMSSMTEMTPPVPRMPTVAVGVVMR